jgi:AraC-like DNA-binding protein
LSSSEIAYLLGYADQSTFFRATLRWFGEDAYPLVALDCARHKWWYQAEP